MLSEMLGQASALLPLLVVALLAGAGCAAFMAACRVPVEARKKPRRRGGRRGFGRSP